MEYPIETVFQDGTFPKGVIRLRVAAICIGLDHEVHPDYKSGEKDEETAPFLKEVEKTKANGEVYSTSLDPHAFLYIQPKGYFGELVKDIENALKESVRTGEIKAASLKISLDGEVDSAETWILWDDFSKWCESRSLDLGDICNEYESSEYQIFDSIVYRSFDDRKELESPYFDESYRLAINTPDRLPTVLEAENERLLRENILMQNGFAPSEYMPEQTAERPLRTTERNILLSLIAVLCKEAKYDYARPAKTAALLKAASEKMGLAIGESTIESHLKKVPDALQSRAR